MRRAKIEDVQRGDLVVARIGTRQQGRLYRVLYVTKMRRRWWVYYGMPSLSRISYCYKPTIRTIPRSHFCRLFDYPPARALEERVSQRALRKLIGSGKVSDVGSLKLSPLLTTDTGNLSSANA